MEKFWVLFIQIWVFFVIALNFLGVIGFAMEAQSILEFWAKLRETYQPFNFWTHGLNMLLLLPSILAYKFGVKHDDSN